jgi:hypothetical protein
MTNILSLLVDFLLELLSVGKAVQRQEIQSWLASVYDEVSHDSGVSV